MEIEIEKKTFEASLALVVGATEARSQIPILGTVLMRADEEKGVSLLCSDTSIVAKTTTKSKVIKGGSVAVDARGLLRLVKAIPDSQTIRLRTEENNRLFIKSGRSNLKLPFLDPESYPTMTPKAEKRLQFTIDNQALAKMIDAVIPAIADNDVRIFLNGALMEINKEGLWLIGSDGHRMVISHAELDTAEADSMRVIISKKTISILRRLLSASGSVTLTLGATDVRFNLEDGTILYSKGIDHKYPEWKKFVSDNTNTILVEGEKLHESVSVLLAIGAELDKNQTNNHRAVDVKIGQSTLEMSCADRGLSEVSIAKKTGENAEMCLDMAFVADSIRAVGTSSEMISVSFKGSDFPVYFRPENKAYPLAIVMPRKS